MTREAPGAFLPAGGAVAAAEAVVEVGEVAEAGGVSDVGDRQMVVGRIGEHGMRPRKPPREHELREARPFRLEEHVQVARADALPFGNQDSGEVGSNTLAM